MSERVLVRYAPEVQPVRDIEFLLLKVNGMNFNPMKFLHTRMLTDGYVICLKFVFF